MKSLLSQFNTPKTHIVISHWPTETGSFDGIATYTQNIVEQLANYSGDKFVILAEGETHEVKQIAKNILLIRAFDAKRVHLYPQILYWLKQFNMARRVYVHSEFCASGGPSFRLLMIPFLMLIKLTGKQITFYAHNVITDFSVYGPHFGKPAHHWSLHLWSFGYRWYFRLLSLWVNSFVTLEPIIKQRLQPLVGNKPIVVTPHWIQLVKRIDQRVAKKRLGIPADQRLIVSFGFVTWYKGADIVARAAKQAQKQGITDQFVLAGGEAVSLKNQSYYRRYFNKIIASSMRVTGFLSEADKHLWLSAADIIIFPYRDLMGGSGALQQALQYHKPLLMSQPMADHLHWDCADMCFSLSSRSLLDAIESVSNNTTSTMSFLAKKKKQLSIKALLPEHYHSVYADNQAEEEKVYVPFFAPTMAE